MEGQNKSYHSQYTDFYYSIESVESLSGILLSEIFNENKFNSLKVYIDKNNLINLIDFTPDHFEVYSKEKGVGNGKLKNIIDKLTDNISNMFSEQASDSIDNDCVESKIVDSIYIEAIFSDKAFLTFLETEDVKDMVPSKIILSLKKYAQLFKGKTKVAKVNLIKNELANYMSWQEKYQRISMFRYRKYYIIRKKTVAQLLADLEILHQNDIDQCTAEFLYSNFDSYCDTEIENYSSIEQKILLSISFMLYKVPFIVETMEKYFNSLTETKRFILENRWFHNETLAEVGAKLGLTRERVRQIEGKLEKEQLDYFDNALMNLSINLANNTQKMLFHSEIENSINPSNALLLIHYVSQDNLQYRYDSSDKLFYHDSLNETVAQFKALLDSFPEVILKKNAINIVYDYIEGFTNIDIEGYIKNLLQNRGYQYSYGEYISNKKISKSKVYDIIFEKYYTEHPLAVNNRKSLSEFKFKYDNEFSDDEEREILVDQEQWNLYERQVSSVLDRSDNIIQVDSKTYKFLDKNSIDFDLLDIIYAYIERKLSDAPSISYKKIYLDFKEELSDENISAYQMYFLLKRYYSDKFKFGKGNTMEIFRKDMGSLSTEEILFYKVEEAFGEISVANLMEQTGYEEYIIAQTVYISKRLMIKNRAVKIIDFSAINAEVKAYLSKIINIYLSDEGFVVMNELYEELLHDAVFCNLIADFFSGQKFMTQDIRYLIKNLFKDIKGHTHILYQKGNPKDIGDVLNSRVLKPTSRMALYEYVKNIGYSEQTFYQGLNEWIAENKIWEIDFNEYISTKCIDISEAIQSEVLKYIDEKIEEKGFIVLVELKELQLLPQLENLEWTPQLIANILQAQNFQKINQENEDYRRDRLIFIKDKAKNISYSDFIKKQLIKYSGALHVTAIYDYLSNLGILKEQPQAYKKKLPIELIDSGIIELNDDGEVRLHLYK